MAEYSRRQWVEIIYEAYLDELTDALYYRRLAMQAPNYEAQELIQRMADDEARHARRLADAYYSFTGRMPEPGRPNPIVGPYPYALNYRFHEETEAVRKYRDYILAAGHGKLRDLFFDLMVDESIHAMNCLYLMHHYCCSMMMEHHGKPHEKMPHKEGEGCLERPWGQEGEAVYEERPGYDTPKGESFFDENLNMHYVPEPEKTNLPAEEKNLQETLAQEEEIFQEQEDSVEPKGYQPPSFKFSS